jgi:hypothetical protein
MEHSHKAWVAVNISDHGAVEEERNPWFHVFVYSNVFFTTYTHILPFYTERRRGISSQVSDALHRAATFSSIAEPAMLSFNVDFVQQVEEQHVFSYRKEWEIISRPCIF